MAFRPLLVSMLHDPDEYYGRPSRLLDEYLGDSIDYNDLLRLQSLLPAVYNAALLNRASSGGPAGRDRQVAESKTNETDYKVNLDIRQFRPDEVNVKLVENRVVIHAKHEEREDQHGFIKREFTRSYLLPNDVDASKLEAKVSNDGTLRISAPRLGVTKQKETLIPIQRETRSSVASPSNQNTSASANTSGNAN